MYNIILIYVRIYAYSPTAVSRINTTYIRNNIMEMHINTLCGYVVNIAHRNGHWSPAEGEICMHIEAYAIWVVYCVYHTLHMHSICP